MNSRHRIALFGQTISMGWFLLALLANYLENPGFYWGAMTLTVLSQLVSLAYAMEGDKDET